MNVTGIEWRGQDPKDGRFAAGARPRRPPKSTDMDEEDTIEIHGETPEDIADGLDEVAL